MGKNEPKIVVSWLNRTLLPSGVSFEEKDGLYAEIFPDGQLAHFGYYENGKPVRWTLTFEHGVERATALFHEGDAPGDREEYRDGAMESFNPWSDSTPPVRIAYHLWVRTWIDNIQDWLEKAKKTHEEAKALRERIEKEGKRAVIKRVK